MLLSLRERTKRIFSEDQWRKIEAALRTPVFPGKALTVGEVCFSLSALAVLFFLYFDGLARGTYVDDNPLIFHDSFIRDAHNPLLYWFKWPGNANTKAWPLTHSIYWLLYNLFHERFWAYRTLNLLLHWMIGFKLFSILSKRVPLSAAAFAAILFWVHPVAVEPVTWISQIGTLLTVLFFAAWFRDWESGEGNRRKTLIPLAGMLATKGFAYFLPFLSFRKRITETRTLKAFQEHIPAFALTAYAAYLVLVGVSFHSEGPPNVPPAVEVSQVAQSPAMSQAPISSVPQKKTRVSKASKATLAKAKKSKASKGKNSDAAKNGTYSTEATSNAAVTPAIAPSVVTQSAAPGVISLSYEYVSRCGKSALFYVFRFLSYSEMPADSLRPAVSVSPEPVYFLFGLSVLAFLCWCSYRGFYIASAAILLYLPVSGIFPAIFLNFYLVADRMIYPSLYVLAMGAGLLYSRIQNTNLRRAFWLWPMLMGAITYFIVQMPRGGG